jgi:type I pantothenate kinase
MQQDSSPQENDRLSHYLVFTREEWAQLRDNTPLTLSEERLLSLRSQQDHPTPTF